MLEAREIEARLASEAAERAKKAVTARRRLLEARLRSSRGSRVSSTMGVLHGPGEQTGRIQAPVGQPDNHRVHLPLRDQDHEHQGRFANFVFDSNETIGPRADAGEHRRDRHRDQESIAGR